MRDRCFSASIFFCMSLTPIFSIFRGRDFGTGVGGCVGGRVVERYRRGCVREVV